MRVFVVLMKVAIVAVEINILEIVLIIRLLFLITVCCKLLQYHGCQVQWFSAVFAVFSVLSRFFPRFHYLAVFAVVFYFFRRFSRFYFLHTHYTKNYSKPQKIRPALPRRHLINHYYSICASIATGLCICT